MDTQTLYKLLKEDAPKIYDAIVSKKVQKREKLPETDSAADFENWMNKEEEKYGST